MAQIDKSFLTEAFPIIAEYIRELYAKHHRFVMRDELAEAFERDRVGIRLLRRQVAENGGSTIGRAGNTVDWFSAKFKIKSPMVRLWTEEFERITLRGKFAYRPKGAIDPGIETLPPGNYFEGSVVQVLMNRFERSPEARAACLAHYGTRCIVCGFDFEREFGEAGRGYIQVHHLESLADIRKSYKVDPIKDLRPVCPNCHAMIHRGSAQLRIEDLIELRLEAKRNRSNRAKK